MTRGDGRPSALARAWAACRPVVGTVLMAVGLVGTVIPVLPGIPLLLAGMAVAGSSHPAVRFVRRHWDRWRPGRARRPAATSGSE